MFHAYKVTAFQLRGRMRLLVDATFLGSTGSASYHSLPTTVPHDPLLISIITDDPSLIIRLSQFHFICILLLTLNKAAAEIHQLYISNFNPNNQVRGDVEKKTPLRQHEEKTLKTNQTPKGSRPHSGPSR